MKKLLPGMMVLILIFTSFPLASQETQDISAYELYTAALENLVDDDTSAALELFHQLVEQYPASALAERAQAYISKYELKYDHSGIVSFYLGNLGTAAFASFAVPTIFDIDSEVVYGATGLLGIGAGLGSASLMTKNSDMSSGQDIWIETIEVMSMTNFALAFELFRPELTAYTPEEIDLQDRLEKINLAGLVVSAVGGRLGAYFAVKDRLPPAGRASFVATSYGWSQAYLWALLAGVLESDNTDLNTALGVVIPDLVAVGSYFFWDRLQWSFQRTGLVTVGGLGGALLGGFTDLILGGIVDNLSSRTVVGVLLGFSVAGQAVTAYLTSGIEPEKTDTRRRPRKLSLFPSYGPEGFGIQGQLRL